MYKKIAIATLIAAPLIAQLAANWTPAPTAPAEQPAEPATPAPAAKPSGMTYSAIPQQQQQAAVIGPFDPTPTLDPTAGIDTGGQPQTPQFAAAAAPGMDSAPVADAPVAEAAATPPPAVNPIGMVTPSEIRQPRF